MSGKNPGPERIRDFRLEHQKWIRVRTAHPRKPKPYPTFVLQAISKELGSFLLDATRTFCNYLRRVFRC